MDNNEEGKSNLEEQKIENIPKGIALIYQKIVLYIDNHIFGLTALIGCFYMISFFLVFVNSIYGSTTFSDVFAFFYYGFFIIYFLFFFILTFIYKTVKYIGHLLLGLFIGFFTCGGLAIFVL